jgi:hypothetical protein
MRLMSSFSTPETTSKVRYSLHMQIPQLAGSFPSLTVRAGGPKRTLRRSATPQTFRFSLFKLIDLTYLCYSSGTLFYYKFRGMLDMELMADLSYDYVGLGIRYAPLGHFLTSCAIWRDLTFGHIVNSILVSVTWLTPLPVRLSCFLKLPVFAPFCRVPVPRSRLFFFFVFFCFLCLIIGWLFEQTLVCLSSPAT